MGYILGKVARGDIPTGVTSGDNRSTGGGYRRSRQLDKRGGKVNIETRMADQKKIMDAFCGIPVRYIWWALQERNLGVNWRGCSKACIAECLARGEYNWDMKDLDAIKQKALSYSASTYKEREAEKVTRKYTVVGTQGNQTIAHVVSARTPKGAAGRVVNSRNCFNFVVIAVFEGERENLMD